MLRRTRGTDAGFQSYDATLPQREAVRPVPERIGPETTQAALAAAERLAASPSPALLWVHYQDPHGPYVPPETQRVRFLKEAAAAADPPELPVSADQSGNGAIPRYQYADGHREPAYYRAGYRGEVAHWTRPSARSSTASPRAASSNARSSSSLPTTARSWEKAATTSHTART